MSVEMNPPRPDRKERENEDRYFKTIHVSLSDPTQGMVTFIVGPEDKTGTFLVHKNLACAHSSVFEAAFENKMKEGLEPTMRLEDVEVKIFGMLVHHLYTQELERKAYMINDGPDDFDTEFLILAKLWKLAERFLVPNIQNHVIIEVLSSRDLVSEKQLKKFAEYVCSTEGSFKDQGPRGALKRVLLEIVAYSQFREIFEATLEFLPLEAMLQVVRMLKGGLQPRLEHRSMVDIQEEFFVEVPDEQEELEH